MLNNQTRSEGDEDNEDDQPKNKKRKRGLSNRFTTSIERQIQETGFVSDLDLIQILDAATLHPKLEVIQIVQVMQDYFEAIDFINYRETIENGTIKSTFDRIQNENIEFKEMKRQTE